MNIFWWRKPVEKKVVDNSPPQVPTGRWVVVRTLPRVNKDICPKCGERKFSFAWRTERMNLWSAPYYDSVDMWSRRDVWSPYDVHHNGKNWELKIPDPFFEGEVIEKTCDTCSYTTQETPMDASEFTTYQKYQFDIDLDY